MRADPADGARLVVFPHAGAGPSAFREWICELTPGVELVCAEYPGRERRREEPPIESLEELLPPLLAGLRSLEAKPTALYGHSMGALVAFEVARALAVEALAKPELLIVSGACAPHLGARELLSHLPTKEFLRALLRLNGIPPQVRAEPALIHLALPVLRADFRLLERYEYRVATTLTCPLLAIGSDRDPRVDRARLEAWRHHAGAAFSQHILPGDHFFIVSARAALLRTINGEIRRTLNFALAPE